MQQSSTLLQRCHDGESSDLKCNCGSAKMYLTPPSSTRQQEGQEWKECHHIYILTLSLIASVLLGIKPSIFLALANGIASRYNRKEMTSLYQRKVVFGVKGSIPCMLAPKRSVANKRLGQGSSLPGCDAHFWPLRWDCVPFMKGYCSG